VWPHPQGQLEGAGQWGAARQGVGGQQLGQPPGAGGRLVGPPGVQLVGQLAGQVLGDIWQLAGGRWQLLEAMWQASWHGSWQLLWGGP